MKKILLIMMLLVSTFLLASCGTVENPMISDPNGTYFSAKEGTNVYTVSNKKIYNILKEQVGYTTLMDLIDTDLMKNNKKDNVSYWDQVTEAEITEKYEEDVFPNGKEDLTEEEIVEQEERYLDKLFANYGLTEEEDIRNHYRLALAKEKYAYDEKVKEVLEEDFKEAEYDNYFNVNYQDVYHAIVVTFSTQVGLVNSLKQLNFDIEDNKLIKSDHTLPSKAEAIELFINLYNMVNLPKNNGELALKEGEQYTHTNGVYEFDLEELDLLKYKKTALSSLEAGIQKSIDNFDNYNDGDNFYTKEYKVYRNGSRYALFMRINKETFTQEGLEAEIKEALIKQKVTATYIKTAITKLRYESGVSIYDNLLIHSYQTELDSAAIKYKSMKSSGGSIIARSNSNEYSADQLFAKMNKPYGISSVISELEFNRFIENPEINKIYDFKTKTVLDATKYTVIQQSIKDEKANFKSNLYEENGFPAKYGWDNFIRDVYGVESEEELFKIFVFQDVKGAYAKSFGDLANATEESDIWLFYQEKMEEIKDAYFNVDGVHFLITVNNDAGSPMDPKDWTEEHIELAEEFYNQVMAYLADDTYPGTAKQKLENIENALNRAPLFVPYLPFETASQPVVAGINYEYNGIEVSKFKSAGIVGKFESLGNFTNGRMVEEFNDAAKSIWDAAKPQWDEMISEGKDVKAIEEITIYDLELNEDEKHEYLVTAFGYHVYVNTKVTPIVEYTAGKVLPDFASAKLYVKNNEDAALSTKLKTALATYIKPVHTELTSDNYLQLKSYLAILEMEVEFNHDDYTNEAFLRFLDLIIEDKEKNLKYYNK